MHAWEAMHIMVYACFYIWQKKINNSEFGGDEKMKVAQEGPRYTHKIFTLLELYVPAVECNAHKHACRSIYLSIALEQLRIWG